METQPSSPTDDVVTINGDDLANIVSALGYVVDTANQLAFAELDRGHTVCAYELTMLTDPVANTLNKMLEIQQSGKTVAVVPF